MRNENAAWQQEYFGRHVQMVPAENAQGYQYTQIAQAENAQTNLYTQHVIRAIPTDGTITDVSVIYDLAPQTGIWIREGNLDRWIRRLHRGVKRSWKRRAKK